MKRVLIGFMGSGKSTVARSLSQLLDIPWIEMDDLLCQKTSTKTMHQLFALGGELLLRETEIAIAKEYASTENVIISTGGGVILNQIIFNYFKTTDTKVTFLHASFEQIVSRLKGDDSRPLFKDLVNAKKLYDFRLPLYLHCADEIIDVDFQTPDEIALKIKHGSSNGL